MPGEHVLCVRLACRSLSRVHVHPSALSTVMSVMPWEDARPVMTTLNLMTRANVYHCATFKAVNDVTHVVNVLNA